jgi:hypothetical protein
MDTTTDLNRKKENAQGMVEFALVLPVLLLLMFGIMEFGRLLFFYSSSANASREAARYGSAAGDVGDYVPHYRDCDGIVQKAHSMGFLANITSVNISYDDGPGTSETIGCPPGQTINLGSRIIVRVTTQWDPIVALVPINPINLTSETRRTILKNVEVEGDPPLLNPPTVSFHTAHLGNCIEGTLPDEEGCGQVILRAYLSHPYHEPVVIFVSASSGTASLGGDSPDFSISPGNLALQIQPGNTSGNFVITVVPDKLYEDNESVIITMVNVINGIIGTPSSSTLWIIDDDSPPTVEFVAVGAVYDESQGPVNLKVKLDEVSGKPVTVNFTVGTESTATTGVDFTLNQVPLFIPAGSLYSLDPETPHITIIDDSLYEENETIVLHLNNPVDAVLGDQTTHTITILDNDIKPNVYFSPANQSGGPNVGELVFQAVQTAPSGLPTVVNFIISSASTAVYGIDYTMTSSPVIIPPGETSAPIIITVIPHEYQEDKTIIVEITTVENAERRYPYVHTATITSNATPPTVWFTTASQSVPEHAGQIFVTARLSFTTGVEVQIPFTVSGTATGGGVDYTISPSPLVIPAGTQSRDIVINIIDDNLYEPDENIILTMGTPVNAVRGVPNVHTVTILNNDQYPALFFPVPANTVYEDGGTVLVEVKLNNPSSQAITAPFSIDPASTASLGQDFTISPSPLTFPAGTDTAVITINVIDDSVVNEGSETVIVKLGDPVNAVRGNPDTYTLIIIDNDACPTAGSLQAPIGLTDKLSLSLSHIALGAPPVTIEEVDIFWWDRQGQKLETIYWKDSLIFDNSRNSSPTLIPYQAPWLAGRSRLLEPGEALKVFEVRFKNILAGTSAEYSIRIRFSNTCEIVR